MGIFSKQIVITPIKSQFSKYHLKEIESCIKHLYSNLTTKAHTMKINPKLDFYPSLSQSRIDLIFTLQYLFTNFQNIEVDQIFVGKDVNFFDLILLISIVNSWVYDR